MSPRSGEHAAPPCRVPNRRSRHVPPSRAGHTRDRRAATRTTTNTTPTDDPTADATIVPVVRARGLELLTGLDARLDRELAGAFACMEWAEQEIDIARSRNPRHADALHHSFRLLVPTHEERMRTDFVYRSHCRELLGRVVSGVDTRPGTAAEVCCAMLATSLTVPLRSSGVGLYARMWGAAGFPELPELDELRVHHEALESSMIDDHERQVRDKLAVPDRHLRGVECLGLHHGVRVRCTFARLGPRSSGA